jgi:hypothetical protein
MQKINIASVLADSELSKKEIAAQLFPGNKYPALALNRVASGEALLDADQISKLSLLVGKPIEVLYSGSDWVSEPSKDGLTITNGDFKAVYFARTGATMIFDKGSLYHETIISSPAITLKEYINIINSEILKSKQNEK